MEINIIEDYLRINYRPIRVKSLIYCDIGDLIKKYFC